MTMLDACMAAHDHLMTAPQFFHWLRTVHGYNSLDLVQGGFLRFWLLCYGA